MQQTLTASARHLGAGVLSAVMLAALAACGGGDGNSAPATVTSMSIAASPKYGELTQVTVVGTNLGNLTLQAPGCKNMTRLTAAPTASTDTTAYFSCTPSGAYTSTIKAVSNGGTVSQTTLTVLPPIVSMAVSGGGVNGNITFNLKGDVAPITVDNFLAYVKSGFYNGLIFHRVANFNNPQSGLGPYFVVQSGGYGQTTNSQLPAPKAPTYAPIALETTGGKNVQWTASMARGVAPDTAQSEFFFNVVDNSATFDTAAGPGYAVFADVSGSAALITQITQAPCTPITVPAFKDGSCVPIPNVTITSATQIQ
jgi:peptidyl-prolyl cis-trans isomerase A (cyclophilin A)